MCQSTSDRLSTLERQIQEVFTRLDDLEQHLRDRRFYDWLSQGESKPSTQPPTTNSDIHYRLTQDIYCENGVTVGYAVTIVESYLRSALRHLSEGNFRNAQVDVNHSLEWLTHILDGVRTEGQCRMVPPRAIGPSPVCAIGMLRWRPGESCLRLCTAT